MQNFGLKKRLPFEKQSIYVTEYIVIHPHVKLFPYHFCFGLWALDFGFGLSFLAFSLPVGYHKKV